MARLTGALFSLAASGTIADTLTFAKWKGIQYARTRVIPANPREPAQRKVRGVFSTLNELWKRMPALGRQPYAAAAQGQAFTDRNKHIGANLKLLRDAAAMSPYIWSIPGGQALPPVTLALISPAPGRINATITFPTAPVGYTLYSSVLGAFERGDPTVDGGIVRTMYHDENLGDVVPLRLDDLPTGDYDCGVWLKWTRTADAKTFYSSFLTNWVPVA